MIIVEAICKLLEEELGHWEGTAMELFDELGAIAEQEDLNTGSPVWPANAACLGKCLHDFLPELLTAGVTVERTKESTGKRRQIIRLRQVPVPEAEPDEQDDQDEQPYDSETREYYRQKEQEQIAEKAQSEKIRRGFGPSPDSHTRYKGW